MSEVRKGTESDSMWNQGTVGQFFWKFQLAHLESAPWEEGSRTLPGPVGHPCGRPPPPKPR